MMMVLFIYSDLMKMPNGKKIDVFFSTWWGVYLLFEFWSIDCLNNVVGHLVVFFVIYIIAFKIVPNV